VLAAPGGISSASVWVEPISPGCFTTGSDERLGVPFCVVGGNPLFAEQNGGRCASAEGVNLERTILWMHDPVAGARRVVRCRESPIRRPTPTATPRASR
jgi:hypothetical protein